MWLACSGASLFSPCSWSMVMMRLLNTIDDEHDKHDEHNKHNKHNDWWTQWLVKICQSWNTSAMLVKSWSLRKTFPVPEALRVRFLEIAENECFHKWQKLKIMILKKESESNISRRILFCDPDHVSLDSSTFYYCHLNLSIPASKK